MIVRFDARSRGRHHSAVELAPGSHASIERVVTDAMTATALGSGDVPVLGTPAVLALMEEAACAAIREALPDGSTSVGTRVDLEHLAPTKLGATVVATAELTAVDGRKLVFRCVVSEGSKEVARATHERALVDRERFLGRA